MRMGLTGGIASGKSTVSAMLTEKGAFLVDADVIAREVMLPGHQVLDAVVRRFGKEMLRPDGSLDRARLGAVIFRDPASRRDLNDLTHPAIRKEMLRRMEACESREPDRLIVADIPLLYETGWEKMLDKVLVVYVPRGLQLERLIGRDGLTAEQAESRLQAQMSIEDKRTRADYVIDNSGSLEDTELQLDRLWDRLGLS